MPKAAEERIVLLVDDKQYRRSLDEAQGRMDRLRGSVRETNEAHGKAGASARQFGDTASRAHRRAGDAAERQTARVSALTRMWRTLVATVGLFGAGVAVRAVFQMNASLEQTRISFRTLIGDAGRADAALKSLFTFAETTPFRLDEVIAAGRSLLAFGFNAEQLEPTLRSLGDVAAGLGIPFKELADIYGKARVQGQIMMEDIHQLTGRGIPIMTALAQVMGVNTGEVRKLVSAGKVGFPQLEAAFATLTDGVGDLDFAGLMEAQSESASGLISTILDLAQAALRTVTTGAFELLKDDLRTTRDAIQRLREDGTLDRWSQKLGAALAAVYGAGRSVVSVFTEYGPLIGRVVVVVGTYAAALATVRIATAAWTAATVVAAAVAGTYRAALALSTAALALLRGSLVGAGIAMQAFNVAIRTNPVGILVTVLGTAVAALTAFAHATDEGADATERANEKMRERIRLLREMGGAALAADRREREREATTAAARYREVQERIRTARTATYRDRTTTEVGPDGRFSVTDTAEAQRTRALVSLNRQLAEAGAELRDARTETFQAERESHRDLDTRAAYLRAELERVTAINEETAESRAEAAELRDEIRQVEATLASRRDEGDPVAPGAGSGSGRSSGQTARQRAAAAAALEREREAAQEFARLTAQRIEAARRMGEAETDALDAVHDAEDDLHRYREELAERRARMNADQVAEAEAYEAHLAATVARLREVYDRSVALSAVAWSGLTSPVRQDARGLAGAGPVTAEEARDVLATWGEINAAVAKAQKAIRDRVVPLDEMREAVGLADEMAAVFDRIGAVSLANLTRSLGDVLDAVHRLHDAQEASRKAGAGGGITSSLGTLAGAVGVASAALGVVQGMVSDAVARAAEARMHREAIRDAAAATRDNTAALRDAAQPASSVSRDEIDAAIDLIRELSGGVGRAYSRKYLDPMNVADENALAEAAGRFGDYLDRLDALSIDGLDTGAYRDLYEEMVAMIDVSKGDDYVQAMTDAIVSGITTGDFGEFDELAAMVGDEFVSLADAAEAVANALGTYADDLGGALAEADDAAEFLGLDGAEAFEEFLSMVRGADEDLGSLGGVLEDAEAGDVDAAVAAAFEAIRAGTFDFGTLSADEVEDVLRRLLRYGDTAGGARSQASSVSSITATQGSLLLGYQQEQLRELRAIRAALVRAASPSGLSGGATAAQEAADAPPTSGRTSGAGGASGAITVPVVVHLTPGESARETARRILPHVERGLVRALTDPDTQRQRD